MAHAILPDRMPPPLSAFVRLAVRALPTLLCFMLVMLWMLGHRSTHAATLEMQPLIWIGSGFLACAVIPLAIRMAWFPAGMPQRRQTIGWLLLSLLAGVLIGGIIFAVAFACEHFVRPGISLGADALAALMPALALGCVPLSSLIPRPSSKGR